jgi:hypothetical protein
VQESPTLLLPADIAAAGFYITNMHNNIIGNVASGGWAGFAFPNLDRPVGLHRTMNYIPREKVALEIDGNTGTAIRYPCFPHLLRNLTVLPFTFKLTQFSSFYSTFLELGRCILFWRCVVLQWKQ